MKNDSVGHSGLSYAADTTFHRTISSFTRDVVKKINDVLSDVKWHHHRET